MSIKDCVEKLVVAGQVPRRVADEAMGLYDRLNARYSAEAGPASSEAAAALATARALRQSAEDEARRIAHDVRTYADLERRVLEHPYGRRAGLMAAMTKDFWRQGKMVRDLAADSPIKTGLNVDYLHQGLRAKLFNMFGAGMEAYRPGFLADASKITGVRNMVREIFGADTGDATAKAAAAGWKSAHEAAENMAKASGKVFTASEDWGLPQHWDSRRVGKFTEDEYVAAYQDEVARGALKVWDKDTGTFATADRRDFVLRRAYNDIRGEGATKSPFSKEMRTFQFERGDAGAESFLRMQGKFGVGNEILAMMTGHLDRMAREVALQRVFGSNHEAAFAAAMRLVKQGPKRMPRGPGAERFNPVRVIAPVFQNEGMLRNTFNVITGKVDQTQSEVASSVMDGARNFVGMSSLRNLPITIIPGDTAMTLLAANHIGMDGLKILGEIGGGTSKEAAAHLQINAHSIADYVNNSVRQYEDEINGSGIIRKVSRGVVNATGATMWTDAGRRAAQTSMMNQIAEMRGIAFDNLNPDFRRFLDAYGFDRAAWNKIRSASPTIVNGAKYYLDPKGIESALWERLLGAVQEQSSYMFHQPDARTRGFVTQGAQRGTGPGELWRSLMQYKQFTVERMTTHLMRTLIDGPIENRIGRGLAFMTLSTAAGAVSLQAANVLAGRDAEDMRNKGFWSKAFIKGGAGGIYSDLIDAGLRGGHTSGDVFSGLAGPVPSLIADVGRTLVSPLREELDDSGRPSKGRERDLVNIMRRNTPNTFYTKLAIDRLWWDKLQTLVDPDYRGSFRRAEQSLNKATGQDFWWGPGSPAPERAPAFTRQ